MFPTPSTSTSTFIKVHQREGPSPIDTPLFSTPGSTAGLSLIARPSIVNTTNDDWQTKLPTIRERNGLMFNNSLLSDIKFQFREETGEVKAIPAHKYVLAISSPVFFSMFYGNIAEKSDTIEITDSDSESFLTMLRHIYSDKVSLCNCEQAMHVWYLANKYFIPSLSQQCVTFLDQNVGVNEVMDVLRYALQFEEKALQQTCWRIIDFRVQTILKSEAFEELDRNILIATLRRTNLPVDEVTLFKALDRWAENKCKETDKELTSKNKRAVIGEDLFRLIRFPVTNQRKFAQEVLPLNYLTNQEAVDIFKHLSDVKVEDLAFPTVPRKKYPDLMYLHRYESVSHGWPNTLNTDTRFILSVNMPIKLCGFSIFGTHKEKYDVNLHVMEQEAASDNVPHYTVIAECKGTFVTNRSLAVSTGISARVFDCLFDRSPVLLEKNIKYAIQASVRGPDSYFGEISSEGGQPVGLSVRSATTSVFGTASGTYQQQIPTRVGLGNPKCLFGTMSSNEVEVYYEGIRFTFETVDQHGTCLKGQIPSVIFMTA